MPGLISRERLDQLRAGSAFAIGLLLPISVSLSEIAFGLGILVLMAERRPPAESWREIRFNPVALAGLALFALLGLATLYSTAPGHEAFQTWIKYRELLYLPILMLLCRDERSQWAGLLGFLAALLPIMVIAATPLYMPLAIYIHDRLTGAYPWNGSFGSHITEGMLVALGGYFATVEAVRRPQHRLAAILFALAALLYMLLHDTGRTGFVILLAVAITLLVQLLPRRLWLGGGAVVLLAAAGLVLFSPTVQVRMQALVQALDVRGQAAGPVQSASPAEGAPADGSMTVKDAMGVEQSISARIEFMRLSGEAFLRHPLLGTGTGSFRSTYEALAVEQHLRPTSNPHSEYVMMAVQAGVVGLAAFLAFLAVLWCSAGRLPLWQQRQARMVIIVFAIGCLFNSLLLDHKDGHSFVFLVSLFFGGAFLGPGGGSSPARDADRS